MQAARSKRYLQFLPMLPGQDCQLCTGACGSGMLCGDCLRSLPKLDAACPICAMPTTLAGPCGTCLKAPPNFESTTAALRYAFPADQLILGLKYGGRLPLARLLGDLLGGLAGMNIPDLLIPMPLHRARLATRGFNQAVEIAKPLAAALRRPVHTGLVMRLRDTQTQAELPAHRRGANVRGAFACRNDLSGMTIAVVDDVMTTGASLNEMAHVLKQAGAARVDNWVVARTWGTSGS